MRHSDQFVIVTPLAFAALGLVCLVAQFLVWGWLERRAKRCEPVLILVVSDRKPLPRLTTIKAWCCREWEVALGSRWGRCGLCGERPEVAF